MNKLTEFTLTILVMELLMGAGVYQIYSMHQGTKHCIYWWYWCDCSFNGCMAFYCS